MTLRCCAERLAVLLLAGAVTGCTNHPELTNPSPTPTTTSVPASTTTTTTTPPTSPTRVIALGGSLTFGGVMVGTTASATLQISDTGNADLNVSGMTLPAGYSSNWTSGTIAVGATQAATITFAPTDVRDYSGTLTVNANQTSGTNTIPLSGSGKTSTDSVGRVVDGLTLYPLAGLTVALDDGSTATTGTDGSLSVPMTVAAGLHLTTLSGSAALTRQTHIRFPANNLLITMFPASLDLTSFDQMIRGSASRLQRWTSPPALVLVTSTLTFTNEDDNSFVATSDQMTDAEANTILSDLQFDLPQLTGGQFEAFSALSKETPAAGSSVNVQRTGSIVVARYKGLRTTTGFVGYGRWAWDGTGAIVGGIVFYDVDYDRSAPSTLRALHGHELGHALGYNHVYARTSIMNPTPVIDPNQADRDATALAFLRTPGNTSPDSDPDSFSTNRLRGQITWGHAVP